MTRLEAREVEEVNWGFPDTGLHTLHRVWSCGRYMWVAECRCGWSSAFAHLRERAVELHEEHRERLDA